MCISHRTRWIRRARVPPPFFFHRYDFYFFSPTCVLFTAARSRAGTVAITSTHCAAVTLHTRARGSLYACRARGVTPSARYRCRRIYCERCVRGVQCIRIRDVYIRYIHVRAAPHRKLTPEAIGPPPRT